MRAADGTYAASLRAVGMARRAGCVEIGTRAVREAGREARLAAILVARDASVSVRQRLERLRSACGAILVTCGDRAALGAAVGRGPVAALGVTDSRLAELVLEPLESGRAGGRPETVAGLEG